MSYSEAESRTLVERVECERLEALLCLLTGERDACAISKKIRKKQKTKKHGRFVTS